MEAVFRRIVERRYKFKSGINSVKRRSIMQRVIARNRCNNEEVEGIKVNRAKG